jgi:hypothetical protein
MVRMTRVFTTFWDYPNDRFDEELDRDEIIGSEASGGRDKPKFRPFDLLKGITYDNDGIHGIPVFDGDDMTVFVEATPGAFPFFHREVDQDVVYFQYTGTSTVQTEFGSFTIGSGDVLIVPRGIAQRTIGSADCLRWALYYRDPVGPGVDVDNPTLNYEFEVRREPSISYPYPSDDEHHGVRADGKIRELIRVREHPEDDTWVWRSYSTLLTAGRTPPRPIVKFGYFNYLKGITGGHGGPPCKPIAGVTHLTHLEAFNTVGEMTAGFHRGADSEEMWIQFGGAAQNESDFGLYVLGTSEMGYVPKGIAHHVVGLDGYLRCTLYAKNYIRQLVTDADHVSDTQFTVTARIREPQAAGV